MSSGVGGWGDALHLFRGCQASQKFSIQHRDHATEFSFASLCVHSIVVFPFSSNFICLHTLGRNTTHRGGVDCRDLLSVPLPTGARVPENYKTSQINEAVCLTECVCTSSLKESVK